MIKRQLDPNYAKDISDGTARSRKSSFSGLGSVLLFDDVATCLN
jgi:hypothetical protein